LSVDSNRQKKPDRPRKATERPVLRLCNTPDAAAAAADDDDDEKEAE